MTVLETIYKKPPFKLKKKCKYCVKRYVANLKMHNKKVQPKVKIHKIYCSN